MEKSRRVKHLIIGGVAGGATAAARIRRNDEKAEIILFEKGEYISYANCGLPYYIGGTIKERDSLFVQTPESPEDMYIGGVNIGYEIHGNYDMTMEFKNFDMISYSK